MPPNKKLTTMEKSRIINNTLLAILTLALTSCSAAGWGRVAQSAEVGYGVTDSDRGAAWGAETMWTSVHPLAYFVEPAPIATYEVEPPELEYLSWDWPVRSAANESQVGPAPEERVPGWWEDEIKVVGMAGAVAAAVVAVWKREMIVGALTREKKRS